MHAPPNIIPSRKLTTKSHPHVLAKARCPISNNRSKNFGAFQAIRRKKTAKRTIRYIKSTTTRVLRRSCRISPYSAKAQSFEYPKSPQMLYWRNPTNRRLRAWERSRRAAFPDIPTRLCRRTVVKPFEHGSRRLAEITVKPPKFKFFGILVAVPHQF